MSEFHTTGTHNALAPFTAVPGTLDMRFRKTKALTLGAPDPALIQALGLAACPLTVDTRTDISATGCAVRKPVAPCAEHRALFAVEADTNLSLCTPHRRPTALPRSASDARGPRHPGLIPPSPVAPRAL